MPLSDVTPVHLLTFTTLYPNAAQPNHGVFVENRLRHLVGSGAAVSTVLAPVPYYPRGTVAAAVGRRFGWDRYAGVPAQETRHGLAVWHQRFAVIPKFGMNWAPDLLAAAAAPALRRLLDAGTQIDVIDAHYVYPDGVAAVILAKRFGLPVTITARGSDITQLPDYPVPRRRIIATLREADALIGVSAALCEAMIGLGADPARVQALRNGIDLEMFRPTDPMPARAELGLAASDRLLVAVGHLIARKRHDLTIAALSDLPDTPLALLGDGPERAALAALAERLGVADRVHLLGSRPHASLPGWYAAADASVLASSREGWANVLLESMACGTPVIASNIAGNPEVVQAPEAGLILRENTAAAIADAARQLAAAPPDRAATRRYAERFGWQETTEGQLRVFRAVLARRSPRDAA